MAQNIAYLAQTIFPSFLSRGPRLIFQESRVTLADEHCSKVARRQLYFEGGYFYFFNFWASCAQLARLNDAAASRLNPNFSLAPTFVNLCGKRNVKNNVHFRRSGDRSLREIFTRTGRSPALADDRIAVISTPQKSRRKP